MRNTLAEAYSRNHITDPASHLDDAINLLEETIGAVELEQREIVRGLTTAQNDIADLRSARDILRRLRDEPSP
jgi:hypothetical protein